MPKREALRELQARLAERLQALRTEPRAAAWLAVESAGCGLLLPLAQAGEIFPLAPLQPIAHTRPWFAGVANLRGQLHGVVDLAAFLGLEPTLAAADAVRDQARLVALNPALGSHCALLVERLAGLRGAEQLERVGEPGGAAFAGPRWRDADGRAWQEIDLVALVRDEHFLAVAA